jgi:hypothetical protein
MTAIVPNGIPLPALAKFGGTPEAAAVRNRVE